MIIYDGPSEIDGAPIVAVITGLVRKSVNRKTGPIPQVWIMRTDMEPHLAVKSGADYSVCGDCKLRGNRGKERACYVKVHEAPLKIYRRYIIGGYGRLRDYSQLDGRIIRIGAYGDPAAVPLYVWDRLAENCGAIIGYTHQWQRFPPLAKYCMASADSPAEKAAANALGFRTFRVAEKGAEKQKGESFCPAQAGKLTCQTCRVCDGTTRALRGSIVIEVHGAGAVHFQG